MKRVEDMTDWELDNAMENAGTTAAFFLYSNELTRRAETKKQRQLAERMTTFHKEDLDRRLRVRSGFAWVGVVIVAALAVVLVLS